MIRGNWSGSNSDGDAVSLIIWIWTVRFWCRC